MVSGGRKKVHTTYPDGWECVEEYDITTDLLLLRKTRKKSTLRGAGSWNVEIGEEGAARGATVSVGDEVEMIESSSNPVLVRVDTRDSFTWRIRNLMYPVDVYNITVDSEKQQLVVRTSNKKYFKRISIEDMERLNLELDPAAVTWKHANRTLVVSYKKPQGVLQAEATWKRERDKLKADKEGDVECSQQ